MRIWILGAALAALAVASADAETLTLTPQPNATQKLGVASGKPALQSEARASSVVLVLQTVTVDAKAAPIFLIGVHNGQAAPLPVAAKAVTAKADGDSLRVFTAEDLRKAAQDRLTIAESELRARTNRPAASGLGQSSKLGYVQSRGGEYLVDTTPHAGSNKQLIADAQARIDAARIALKDADAAGFKPLTVAPGDNAWTPMTLAPLPKAAAALQVSLTLAGETHTFAYAVTRQP